MVGFAGGRSDWSFGVGAWGRQAAASILAAKSPQSPKSKNPRSVLLFFDTETTGLPRDYRAPLTDGANWPRVVQLAWILFDCDGTEQASQCNLIRPEGWTVPPNMIHGISHAQAVADGRPLRAALAEFSAAAEQAHTLVAHNFEFDRAILGAEYVRLTQFDPIPARRAVCTMKTTANYCAIPAPNGRGYKWPKLGELHERVFNQRFEGAHDALADVRATARCYWALRRQGVI